MLAAGYAERERIKQEQGNIILVSSVSSYNKFICSFFPSLVSGLILII